MYCAGVKYPAADALSRLSTNSSKTALKDDFPVLGTKSGVKMDDIATTIVVLEAHESTPARVVIDACGSDDRQQTLNAQSTNERFQIVGGKLDQTGTKFTLNKEGVLVRHGLLITVYRSSSRSYFGNTPSACHISF